MSEASESLIDHMCISEDAKVLHHKVVKYSTSDHLPVLVKLDMKNKFFAPKFIEIKYRNFKKYNHEALILDLENAVWPDCSNLNVNEAVEEFTSTLNAIVNKHFPQINKRVKRVTQPGWITADILKCMKLRDGSKWRGKYKERKLLRIPTLKLIWDAKARCYKESVETNKHNPTKLAKVFDELSGKCKDNSVTSLTYKDKTLVKGEDIADAFNPTLPTSLRNSCLMINVKVCQT